MTLKSPPAKQPEKKLVFIVEDEADIANLISLALVRNGFATCIFHDEASVMDAVAAQLPALILLDRMLPRVDGLEILRSIKAVDRLRHIKTIIVSALNSETDKVTSLELGADDYITKPFSPRELVARARAVLRSERDDLAHRVLQVGNLIADIDSRKLTLDGRELDCSTTEFDLLTYFMRHLGQTLSRRHLLEKLWASNWQTLDSRVVDVYVHRLRQKIEFDAANPTRLVTHRGGGYALVMSDSPAAPTFAGEISPS